MLKYVQSTTSFAVLCLVLFQINLVIAKSNTQSDSRSYYNKPESNWSNADNFIKTTVGPTIWHPISSKAEIMYLNDDSAEWVRRPLSTKEDHKEPNRNVEVNGKNQHQTQNTDLISNNRRQFSQEDEPETESTHHTKYRKFRANEIVYVPVPDFERSPQGFNVRAETRSKDSLNFNNRAEERSGYYQGSKIQREDRSFEEPTSFRAQTFRNKGYRSNYAPLNKKQMVVKRIPKNKFVEDDDVPSKQKSKPNGPSGGRYEEINLKNDRREKYQREKVSNNEHERNYDKNKRETTRSEKHFNDKERYKNKKVSDQSQEKLIMDDNPHQSKLQNPKGLQKGEEDNHERNILPDELPRGKEKNHRDRYTTLPEDHIHDMNNNRTKSPNKHNNDREKTIPERNNTKNQEREEYNRDRNTKKRNRERGKDFRDTLDRYGCTSLPAENKLQKRYSVKDNTERQIQENSVSEKKKPNDKNSDRDRDRNRDRDRIRDRDLDRDHDRNRDRDRDRDRNRDRDRDRDRNRDRDRDHDRDRNRDRDLDRDHDRNRDRDRDRDSDRNRDRDLNRNHDRDRGRNRDRDFARDRISSSKSTTDYEKKRNPISQEKELGYKDNKKKEKQIADKDDQHRESSRYKEKEYNNRNKTVDKYDNDRNRYKKYEPNTQKERPNKDEIHRSKGKSKYNTNENEKRDKKSSPPHDQVKNFDDSEITGRSIKDRSRGLRDGHKYQSKEKNKSFDKHTKDKDKHTSDENKDTNSERWQSNAVPVKFKLSDSSSKDAKEIKDIKTLNPHSIAKQMNCFLKELESTAEIDQEIIGRTVEYNDIVLWKVKEEKSRRVPKSRSNKAVYADDVEKKIVFIVHGLTVMGWHALDCLSNVKRFKTLISYYFENLNLFDIYLVPMANPDGVSKATSAGWWNKNVSPQKACPGVNLDRNFEVAWNATLTKNMSSCSQNYPGPLPFSEHESKAIRNVFHKYGQKIVAYLHVHAGTYDPSVFKGDAILYPKGYSESTGDDDKYMDLRGEVEEAMRKTDFKVISVTVDTLYSWYGYSIGTSVDYASSIYGIPYAMELVMQLYDDNKMVIDPDKRERNTALSEIWQPLIDIVFNHIANTSANAE